MSDLDIGHLMQENHRLRLEIMRLEDMVEVRTRTEDLRTLIKAFGITKNEASFIMLMFLANGTPVSKETMINERPRQQRRRKWMDNPARKRVFDLRKKLPPGSIITEGKLGYCLSQEMTEKVAVALGLG